MTVLNFALVNIAVNDTRKNIYPLGLAYLAGCLAPYGEVRIFDLHYSNDNRSALFHWINEVRSPAFIGLSMCSHPDSIRICSTIAQQIKMLSPNTIVGVGGPHPTYQGKELLAEYLEFDAAFIGPGELATSQIAENLYNKISWTTNVNNLVFRNQLGEVVVSTIRSFRFDSLPARVFLPSAKEYAAKYQIEVPVISIDSSRGCHGNCTFCALSLDKERRYALRHTSLFKTDIETTIEREQLSAVDLFITDADFLASKTHAYQVLKAIESINGVRHFSISCRADSLIKIDNSVLELLFSLGCNQIEIGIESASDSQLIRYNKRTTSEVNIKAMEYLLSFRNKYSFSIQIDMIIFEPMVTMEEARQSIRFLLKYAYGSACNEMNFFHRMILFPGTEYRRIMYENELISQANSSTLPFWYFSDKRVAQLYSYIFLYQEMLFNSKNSLQKKLEQNLKDSVVSNLHLVHDLRVIQTLTYKYVSDLLDAIQSDYPMVFEQYCKLFDNIQSNYN